MTQMCVSSSGREMWGQPPTHQDCSSFFVFAGRLWWEGIKRLRLCSLRDSRGCKQGYRHHERDAVEWSESVSKTGHRHRHLGACFVVTLRENRQPVTIKKPSGLLQEKQETETEATCQGLILTWIFLISVLFVDSVLMSVSHIVTNHILVTFFISSI